MRTEPTVSKIFAMFYMFCVFHSPTLHAVIMYNKLRKLKRAKKKT